jgi:hypothetical protein
MYIEKELGLNLPSSVQSWKQEEKYSYSKNEYIENLAGSIALTIHTATAWLYSAFSFCLSINK